MPKKQDKPPADQVLEGDAIEINDGDTGASNVPKARHGNSTAKTIVTGLALLAIFGGAFFAYNFYNKVTKTDVVNESADLANMMMTQAQQVQELTQRLTSLKTAHDDLAVVVAGNQQAVANTQSTGAVDANLLALQTQLDLVLDRIDNIERERQQAADNTATGKSPNPNNSVSVVQNEILLAQTNLAVINAMLSDNTVGGSLVRWLPIIDQLTAGNVVLDGLAVLRSLIAETPPSRSILLADGRGFISPMISQTHDAGAQETVIDQVTTQLSKLVQLRPVDQSLDGATGHLARFEAALASGDLEGAASLSKTWPGPVIIGLDEWHDDAAARIALDHGLTDVLVTAMAQLNDAVLLNAGDAE